MVRTPKTKQPITASEIADAIIVLRIAQGVLADAGGIVAAGGSLETEYKPSLERSIKALRTFSDALRMAVEIRKAEMSPASQEEEAIRKLLLDLSKGGDQGSTKKPVKKRGKQS